MGLDRFGISGPAPSWPFPGPPQAAPVGGPAPLGPSAGGPAPPGPAAGGPPEGASCAQVPDPVWIRMPAEHKTLSV